MKFEAPNLNHAWARLLVEELRRAGVCHFCVSPGSRSTPLAHAVAAMAGDACTVHFDERGAAFHALGWARATGRPAALICTSGSAVANAWPAVVEAWASRVPLLLLTADRPPELLDCGANQAIDQRKIFGDYVRWAAELPCPDAAIAPGFVLTTADQAVYRATQSPAGPVHLNCQFREPLAPVADGVDLSAYCAPLATWAASDTPYTTYHAAGQQLDALTAQPFLTALRAAQNGVLVVGQLSTSADIDAARTLAYALGWPVCADVSSGLRLGEAGAPFVPYYDQLLLSEAFREAFRPDFVLHLGGPVTSKRLQEHLLACAPVQCLVADHPARQDPTHRLAHRFEIGVAAFCAWLQSVMPDGAPAPEAAAWSVQVGRAMDQWLDTQSALTEMQVARVVSRLRPGGSTLFLGNSMPIRDMDCYGAADGAPGPVAANRGASGIDGNIACAAGHAAATGTVTTALLGDLATLHDLNALALLRTQTTPLVLIVINNDGGGIFHFLPVAAHEAHFERFFGTPHGMTFAAAAAQFGLHYAQPETAAALAEAYTEALGRATSTLIEVRTHRESNIRQHRALQAELRELVSSLVSGR